ncbi:MAG: sigma 54-interacting transcriptional regulator, partial [Planctomycetota bacterium]
MSRRILVAVADGEEREALARMIAGADVDVTAVASRVEAQAELAGSPWDYVLADLQFPDGSVLELMAGGRGGRVVVLHDSDESGLAHALRRAGAYAACRKPVDEASLRVLLGQAEAEGGGLRGMVGRTPVMDRLFDVVRRVGNSHATVLVEGESGTGKELVARALHAHSPRAEGPFVAVNCAALSAGLLESELFGHERGAFTGAHRARRGRFELADGGTLLLDEIGEMDPALQAKLLRALEEMMRAGQFREDLYYRLNVIHIAVPPLRKRPEDIVPLAERLLVDRRRRDA